MSFVHKTIAGAGGGAPKSPKAANEAPDTLFSDQEAALVDVICEGPIEGFATPDPFDAIYMNETPIRQFIPPVTSDLPQPIIELRVGDVNQTHIPGFTSAENSIRVGEKVEHGRPITRSITDTFTDRVALHFAVSSLWWSDRKSGDISAHSLSYNIEVRGAGDPSFDTIQKVLSGKTRTNYGWTVVIDVSAYTPPYEVRITRVSPNPGPVYNPNAKPKNRGRPVSDSASEFYWTGYTEIRDLKLEYPGTAHVALRVRASQFNQVPDRAYLMKLKKVLVPSNYNPTTRTYTGDWDGTFVGPVWTNNPAWCLRDLILSKRGGLGNFVTAAELDKWALYEIAKYCDTMVPSGRKTASGSDILEPRFTLNVYLQEPEEAFKVISDLSAAFRGAAYWYSGMISWTQDRPRDALKSFTPANVVDGQFSYTNSGKRTRHTVAKVRWNDPDNFYLPAVEYVEDQVSVARDGYLVRDVTALGCTSRGQATRLGKWILLTEQAETEVCTFVTGLDAMALLPGFVINVVDPMRTAKRVGGRVRSGTLNSVELDAPVTLQPGTSYDIIVAYPDRVVEITAPNTASQLTIPNSPRALTAMQIVVHKDTDLDGVFDAEVQVADYVPGATDADPGIVKIVPASGSGSNIKWRVSYPQNLQTRAVASVSATTETAQLPVTTAFTDVPEPGAIWVLTEPNITPKPYRVVRVTERANFQFEVTALEYNAAKYTAIESDLLFIEPNRPSLPPPPGLTNPPVTAIDVQPEIRSTPSGTRQDLHITWFHPDEAGQRGFRVVYTDPTGITRTLAGPGEDSMWPTQNAVIQDGRYGVYTIRVTAVNAFYRESPTVEHVFNFEASTLIDAVSVVRLEIRGQGADATWRSSDLELSWQLSAPANVMGLADDNPINQAVDPTTGLPTTSDVNGAPIGTAEIPGLKHYVVRLFDEGDPTNNAIHTAYVPVTGALASYTFTLAQNAASGNEVAAGYRVARRRLWVDVAVEDIYGTVSDSTRLLVENSAPETPALVDVKATFGTVFVTAVPADNDPDRRGLVVWASTNGPTFAPTPDTQVAVGNTDGMALFDAPIPGVTYYVKAAFFDSMFPIAAYTGADVSLLNVSTAQAVETPFVDGEVDIAELSIGELQLKAGAVGFLQIKDAAIGSAKIRELTVDTIRMAPNAVTQLQERSLSEATLIDTYADPSQVGAWVTMGAIPIVANGGVIAIFTVGFVEVVKIEPSISSINSYGQLAPRVSYRLVRNLGHSDEAVVFESGRISLSATGFFLVAQANRLDQPPAGSWLYELQLQQLPDVYEDGLAISGSSGDTSIDGVGTRWIPNVVSSGMAGAGLGDDFTFLDGSGNPVGTTRTVTAVTNDFALTLSGGTTITTPPGGQAYRITRDPGAPVWVSKAIIEQRAGGYLQAVELKR